MPSETYYITDTHAAYLETLVIEHDGIENASQAVQRVIDEAIKRDQNNE